MNSPTNKLFRLDEVEYLVRHGGIVPFAMARQLADTMRENERLRNAIGNLNPIKDFDWHGKWRIHSCLKTLSSSKQSVGEK